MDILRKQDLSIYYFLVDLFQDAPFITIVDGFPVQNLVVPSISVEAKMLNKQAFEMGNRRHLVPRVWIIDIFAKDKAQRDEFGYRIFTALDDPIPVYDYDEGFPPSVSPTQLGSMEIMDTKMEIIKVLPELVDNLYYRATVTFVASYSKV